MSRARIIPIRLLTTLATLALLLGTPAPWAATSRAEAGSVAGDALPRGPEVVRRVNARDDGQRLSQTLIMQLVDSRGSVRERRTRNLRKDFDDGRRSLIFFETPKNVKDTGFLTFDYPAPDREDDLWLYLPALRKVRRIATADRGGSFVGTDFSYEDIKLGTRLSAHDYAWKTLGREPCDELSCILIEGSAVDDETADELGYARLKAWVDPEIWMVRRAEFWDEHGRPLKQVRVGEIRRVDGRWTPHRLEALNHRSGHRTIFRIEDPDYEVELPDDLFTRRSLRRGL